MTPLVRDGRNAIIAVRPHARPPRRVGPPARRNPPKEAVRQNMRSTVAALRSSACTHHGPAKVQNQAPQSLVVILGPLPLDHNSMKTNCHDNAPYFGALISAVGPRRGCCLN